MKTCETCEWWDSEDNQRGACMGMVHIDELMNARGNILIVPKEFGCSAHGERCIEIKISDDVKTNWDE